MKQIWTVCAVSILIAGMLLIAGCTTQESPSPAPAPTVTPAHTEEEMVAFVHEAVAYAQENGKDRALAVFSDRNGSFFRDGLYIYAYDFNGTTLAHPVNPEKIGVNRLDETDVKGNFYIRELRDVARNGSGFVYFYYVDPMAENTVQPKLGYVERVDETWWLGSGIYGVTAPEAAS
ncbi:cache domain-containing protein [Methanofollis fontis]|uniref:Histidine kinase n=1 Tax=Methanofollis fontis TaxID=2052832 RepID=A0A483CZB5_9EURY|nr:cache domain-containing protein [Methanofollis fontis]TAJ45682.1 histidine kinase [Methanofollis fontis]